MGKKCLSIQDLVQQLELILLAIETSPIDDVDVKSRLWHGAIESVKKYPEFSDELHALENVDFGEIGPYVGIGNDLDNEEDLESRLMRREKGLSEAKEIMTRIKQSRFYVA